jgi:preprotein translocase subunit SecD
MITGPHRFNLYLMLGVVLALTPGCQTPDEEKELATLRLHLESSRQSAEYGTRVPVYRAKPVMVTVDKGPFLTEANVAEARVVEVLGGFDLQVKFDRQGTWLLESYSGANPGKRIAIFSVFGGKTTNQSRWIAAPVLPGRITSGVLAFPPDASREEAEQIALGLNNAAKKNEEEKKW